MVNESVQESVERLSNQIRNGAAERKRLDNYYSGAQRIEALGMAVPPKLRQLTTVVNWPRLYVDSLEARLDVEGFRLSGDSTTDDRLNEWWQANNLDEESSLAHTEALIHGIAYIVVGYDEAEPTVPLITVESAESMTVDIDPRTRTVTQALRLYDDGKTVPQRYATLYREDAIHYLIEKNGKWVYNAALNDGQYRHNYGRVPVVPMTNRARITQRFGYSEMGDVIPLTDAACRAVTGLQAAQEMMALPQRYLLGVGEEAFKDPEGNTKTAWELYTGAIFATSDTGVTAGQWSAADLRQFADIIRMYASQVASQTGLPPQYLGVSSENPSSAEAIRMSEGRLVKTAERKSRMFGGTWEEVMRLALIVEGENVLDKRRLETVWRDPSTPTFSSRADAVVKLVTAGLYDQETALERMGESQEAIKKIMSRSSQNDPLSALAASLDRMDGANAAGGVQQGDRQPGSATNRTTGSSPLPVPQQGVNG